MLIPIQASRTVAMPSHAAIDCPDVRAYKVAGIGETAIADNAHYVNTSLGTSCSFGAATAPLRSSLSRATV